jgi:hypothetical protein
VGASGNFQVIFFSKSSDLSLFYRTSNGISPYTVWKELNISGSPTSASAFGTAINLGKVVANLTAGASAGGTAEVNIRRIQPIDSLTLPFKRILY